MKCVVCLNTKSNLKLFSLSLLVLSGINISQFGFMMYHIWSILWSVFQYFVSYSFSIVEVNVSNIRKSQRYKRPVNYRLRKMLSWNRANRWDSSISWIADRKVGFLIFFYLRQYIIQWSFNDCIQQIIKIWTFLLGIAKYWGQRSQKNLLIMRCEHMLPTVLWNLYKTLYTRQWIFYTSIEAFLFPFNLLLFWDFDKLDAA